MTVRHKKVCITNAPLCLFSRALLPSEAATVEFFPTELIPFKVIFSIVKAQHTVAMEMARNGLNNVYANINVVRAIFFLHFSRSSLSKTLGRVTGLQSWWLVGA